jgi:flavin-dependent dehydrogenase
VTSVDRVDVAIVGGGLSGAALAARLAAAGRDVVVLERSREWRWRACGVFASPAALSALRRTGLDEPTIRAVAGPIPAMRVETPTGTAFRLTYGAEDGGEHAVGFDRSRLDPALLRLASGVGAEVRTEANVIEVDLERGEITTRDADGASSRLRPNVIVGADGLRSVVARSAGVARATRLGPRVGLTYHLEDADEAGTHGAVARDARMCVVRDGYVGIAPVPGGRVNIGVVLGESWRPRLAHLGAQAVTRSIVEAVEPIDDDAGSWRFARRCDPIAGASPLGHRVTRRAGTSGRTGHGWLLIGDAAGFLDPFTGEGIHRALVSAELAGRALLVDATCRPEALAAYDRQMRRRFVAKDAVSWLVQGFLARPRLFEYAARRLASRPPVRATMGLVMGDLVPPSRGLDPRYLAALLAP